MGHVFISNLFFFFSIFRISFRTENVHVTLAFLYHYNPSSSKPHLNTLKNLNLLIVHQLCQIFLNG